MWTKLLVFCAGLSLSYGSTFNASFDMAGFKGVVSFADSGSGADVALSFTSSPSDKNTSLYDTVELWSLPAVFGRHKSAVQVCASEIGVKEKTATLVGASGTFSDVQSAQYYHHTALVRSSSDPSLPALCATILPQSSSVSTYRAKFIGQKVFGSVWLRHHGDVGTYVYYNLAAVDEASPIDLAMYIRSGGNIDYESDFNNRCSGLTGSETKLSNALSISNTTLSGGTSGFMFFNTTAAYEGRTLTLKNGDDVVSCAELHSVSSKSVSALINWTGIKGTISFMQDSPFDVTVTNVDLTGLTNRTSGYHVHNYPVPQRMSADSNVCLGQYVGGHFNPYGVVIANSPSPGNGSSDEYEVGDLSGKYGTLAGLNKFSGTFKDWNLPLFGPNSIVGRSIVIHNNDASGSRLMCATIGFPSDVTTGIAVFKWPAYGNMYFRQISSNSDDDTMVFLELASTTMTSSSSHNWHVHQYPVNDDAYASGGICASAGAHYNPSGVSLDDPYSTECNENNPFRCELGDLSGRLGRINVATTQPTNDGKFFFTDEYLPLSGPYSILSRSVVVHGENSAAARLACANITQLHPVIAKTSTSWVGTADGSASGDVTLQQATEFDPTSAVGSFKDLNSLAGGYHIHEFAIPSNAEDEEQCSLANVADHYIPFGWDIKNSPSPANGTYDQYEVGDLSGKYGRLDGVSSASISSNIMDTNLPLHTRFSSGDRSIVIHKTEGNARWKCANLTTVPPAGSNGYAVSATVTFTTTVTGTIKMRQVVYEDGGSSLTSFDVNVNPKSGDPTLQHNWHIHVEPITDETSCGVAAGHYDPYDAISNTNYPTGCSPNNPLYCEVGDLSAKQAKYDIGGGRKLFHDVDSPMHTNFTVLGRSIVFHVINGGADRYTCANIVPDDFTYTLSFPEIKDFNRYDFTSTLASALDVARLRVIILHNVEVPVVRSGCSLVMVHIAGGDSVAKTKIDQLTMGTLPGLGKYSSTSSCVTKVGATVIGQHSAGFTTIASSWMVFMGLLVTVLTTKLL